MSQSRLILIALLAVTTMSAVPVLVKSTAANEVTIAVARLGIAAAVFMPFALWRGRIGSLSGGQWRQLVIVGLVFGAHWLLYFMSIKLSTASIAALTMSTYGVQYLALAWLFNHERITAVEWAGVAAAFTGCLIVSPDLSWQDDTARGIAIGLVSALLYAALPLLHQRAGNVATVTRTWGQFFFGLLLFVPLWAQIDWTPEPDDLYKLLALGLVCTVISHGLWVKASTELPALYTGMIYYLYLPLAAISSAFFLDEAMTLRKLAGIGIVVTASLGLSIYRYRRTVALN